MINYLIVYDCMDRHLPVGDARRYRQHMINYLLVYDCMVHDNKKVVMDDQDHV